MAQYRGRILFSGGLDMKVIKDIVEDTTLSPVEKVLFAILYCRKEGIDCHLSVQEIVRSVGVELDVVRGSVKNLEDKGFIRLKEDCQITDASSFLSCAVLGDDLKHKEPDVPRP